MGLQSVKTGGGLCCFGHLAITGSCRGTSLNLWGHGTFKHGQDSFPCGHQPLRAQDRAILTVHLITFLFFRTAGPQTFNQSVRYLFA